MTSRSTVGTFTRCSGACPELVLVLLQAQQTSLPRTGENTTYNSNTFLHFCLLCLMLATVAGEVASRLNYQEDWVGKKGQFSPCASVALFCVKCSQLMKLLCHSVGVA